MQVVVWTGINANATFTKTVPISGGVNAGIVFYIDGTACNITINILDGSGNIIQIVHAVGAITSTSNVAVKTAGNVIVPGFPSLITDSENLDELRVYLVIGD